MATTMSFRAFAHKRVADLCFADDEMEWPVAKHQRTPTAPVNETVPVSSSDEATPSPRPLMDAMAEAFARAQLPPMYSKYKEQPPPYSVNDELFGALPTYSQPTQDFVKRWVYGEGPSPSVILDVDGKPFPHVVGGPPAQTEEQAAFVDAQIRELDRLDAARRARELSVFRDRVLPHGGAARHVPTSVQGPGQSREHVLHHDETTRRARELEVFRERMLPQEARRAPELGQSHDRFLFTPLPSQGSYERRSITFRTTNHPSAAGSSTAAFFSSRQSWHVERATTQTATFSVSHWSVTPNGFS